MPDTDGTIIWRVSELERTRATKESVVNVSDDVKDLKGDIAGLKKILIATAISWAGGSAAFLIAVLELTK